MSDDEDKYASKMDENFFNMGNTEIAKYSQALETFLETIRRTKLGIISF